MSPSTSVIRLGPSRALRLAAPEHARRLELFCHVLPPSEIDGGLVWAAFTSSKGKIRFTEKYPFHRIGWKGRMWQESRNLWRFGLPWWDAITTRTSFWRHCFPRSTELRRSYQKESVAPEELLKSYPSIFSSHLLDCRPGLQGALKTRSARMEVATLANLESPRASWWVAPNICLPEELRDLTEHPIKYWILVWDRPFSLKRYGQG